MKEVKLEYKVCGITRKVTASLPERWGELTAEQLIAVAKNYKGGATDKEILSVMLGVKRTVVIRFDEYQKFVIAKALDFLNDVKPEDSFIIKVVRDLHSPKPRLENMPFGQFIFSDRYHEDAITKDDEDALNKFVASLYLPTGMAFAQEKIEDGATYVRDYLNGDEKTAILLNYRLIKEWLSVKYPLIFLKPDPDEKKGPQKGNRGGWVSIFEAIVGDDIVSQEKYAAIPVHTVLRYMTKKIKKNGRR